MKHIDEVRNIVYLFDALDKINCASEADLRDANRLADIIRSAGLSFDERRLYGADNAFMNNSIEGVWQIPTQLAPCLIALSYYSISSVIEIGTWSGWTTSLLGGYLFRFNPNIRILTIDLANGFVAYQLVRKRLPIQFHRGTSADFRNRIFDLAIIDGDHRYSACREDYENVGRNSGICMLHDINDRYVLDHEPNDGGVPRLWNELIAQTRRPSETMEFLHHSELDSIMGLGLLITRNAKLRSGKI